MKNNLNALFGPLPIPQLNEPCCDGWSRILARDFLRSASEEMEKRQKVLLWAFHSELILKNLEPVREMFKRSIRKRFIDAADRLLRNLSSRGNKSGKSQTFIGVHVRRTDYLDYLDKRFRGDSAGNELKIKAFFKMAFQRYRREFERPIFVVASDDPKWCADNFKNESDLHILSDSGQSSPEAVFFDFAALSNCNHSIYDWGSFGFWTSALAGGKTLLASGYSNWTHPLLKAIIKYPPKMWEIVDVRTLSLTWSEGWHCKSKRVFTTPTWPLLTAIWRAVCRRLFLAFRSAPAWANSSITAGSSPKAAWWAARSPSLSSISNSALCRKSVLITWKWLSSK